MKHQSARRSSLFLMELILAILFFSLASAVCIRLFVKAHTIGNDTQNLNRAVTQSQSAAEILSGCDGNLSDLQTFFPESRADGSQLTVYYTDTWSYTEASSYTYRMEITCEKDTDPVQYKITVLNRDGSEIYELHTAYHTPVKIEEAE